MEEAHTFPGVENAEPGAQTAHMWLAPHKIIVNSTDANHLFGWIDRRTKCQLFPITSVCRY